MPWRLGPPSGSWEVRVAADATDAEVEAARAYDRQAVEWFGEFARLNFPEEWPPQRRAAVYNQRQEPDDEGERKKAKGKR